LLIIDEPAKVKILQKIIDLSLRMFLTVHISLERYLLPQLIHRMFYTPLSKLFLITWQTNFHSKLIITIFRHWKYVQHREVSRSIFLVA